MSHAKSTKKGGTKGKAEGDKQGHHRDLLIKRTSETFISTLNGYTADPGVAEFVARTLAVAYADDEERELTRQGRGYADTVLDALSDLSNELGVYPHHPDIINTALPVILREAKASDSPAVRKLLRGLKEATRRAEKGGRQ